MATICIKLHETGQIVKAQLIPADYKFLPLVACTDIVDGQDGQDKDVPNYNKQHQNDKPSKSFIQGGNETCGEFLKDEDYGKNREYSIYELITNSADNKKIELEITLQSGSRRCYYDETMYISTKVTDETVENKVKKVTVDKEGKPLKYNDKLKLTIETTLKEGESLSFYVDFYARKKTTDENPLHCGRMKFIVKGKCYCNRDFIVQEVKNIVKILRENTFYKTSEKDKKNNPKLKDKYPLTNLPYYSVDKIFHRNDEKVSKPYNKEILLDNSFESFTKNLNKIFRKYKIDTCEGKAHFLAQIFIETQYFTSTIEKDNSYTPSYDPYRGRGFIHLSLKGNYKKYAESNIGDDKKSKVLEDYSLVAKDIEIAADVGGWYWDSRNINKIIENSNNRETDEIIKAVTKVVNGNQMLNLEERKNAYHLLIKVLKSNDL